MPCPGGEFSIASNGTAFHFELFQPQLMEQRQPWIIILLTLLRAAAGNVL
jgi:hypothetical protein